MRLSNLEEGSYNNTPEPRKMQVTVADKKAGTEAWKRYKAGDPRYEFKNPTSEAEVQVDEAGGYYTQPVYDMIEKHGYEKVMHELLTSLEADVIQDFISRADLDEGKSPHKKGTAKYKKHMAAMHAEGTQLDEDTKGRDESVKNIDEILVKMGADAPSDIIADIMHWIDAHPGENLEDLIRQANGYYNDELEETKINEFGPDERYMKIGNNTMIANKKTGSVSSTLNLGGDKSATVNNHLNKDGSVGKVSARGTVNGVKFKASNNVTGTAPKASASMRGITINASEEPKVREAGSPWTTTGKHPEKMTTDELWSEIAVFDHIQDRGERLTPKDMMRLDSLFSYLDTAEMNEQIKHKADSMMESAVWKAKRNK
jgi:hypothetical protein